MSTTADRLHDGELEAADLFGALADPALNSMNFLNEISSRYPDAISLAAGRPAEQFFEIDSLDRYLRRFCQHLADPIWVTRRSRCAAPCSSTAGPRACCTG